jgi:hypothetical protein
MLTSDVVEACQNLKPLCLILPNLEDLNLDNSYEDLATDAEWILIPLVSVNVTM